MYFRSVSSHASFLRANEFLGIVNSYNILMSGTHTNTA